MKITFQSTVAKPLHFAARTGGKDDKRANEKKVFIPRRPRQDTPKPPSDNPLQMDENKTPFADEYQNLRSNLSGWEFSSSPRGMQGRRAQLQESLSFLKKRFRDDPEMSKAYEALKGFVQQQTWEEAKPFYRKMARICHPDVTDAPADATEIIQHINRLKPKNI